MTLCTDATDRSLLEKMLYEEGEVNDLEIEFQTKTEEKRPAYFQ
jgi:hypothetical protein